MKKSIILFIVIGIICVLGTVANATPLKWSQPPDMSWGFDINSYVEPGYDPEYEPPSTQIVADDWYCADGLPITDIHWWGSYNDWSGTESPGVISGFMLGVFDNEMESDPDEEDWYHPGELLYFLFVGLSDVNEAYAGQQQYAEHSVFSYYLDFSDKPLEQEAGKTYWLAIAAIQLEESYYKWGWSTTDPDSRHLYDACYLSYNGESWEWMDIIYEEWVNEDHPYYEAGSVDMAFELTTIPEPASMILLGSLATGLFGVFGIRRKFARR